MKPYFVYILTNKTNTTLYIGMTEDLANRIEQHRSGAVEGFTKKYRLKKLVYAEVLSDLDSARRRERQLKKWNRQWKIDLIEETNPGFYDLGDCPDFSIAGVPASAGKL